MRPPGSPIGWRPRRGTILTAVVLVAVTSVMGGLFSAAGAGSPTPQIPGSVAAPTAAEISPICQAPDTTGVLGPSSTLPSTPTSTLISPPGGVVNFTALSTGIYVNTGSKIITYTLGGSEVSSFSLPAGIAQQNGNEVSQPVVDTTGDIYLSSYYNQVVDKFSPSGALLWSVDPAGGNPTGLFPVGSGSSEQVAVSLTQNHADSDLLNPTTGAISGTFPLVDDFDYVTTESDGDLLVSGNGYVQTLSPTGTVLSTFGSRQVEGAGVHTGSGSQFYYPAQAVQGPDGTIYTADPQSTIESTSPQGYFEDSTTLGQNSNGGDNLAMGGENFYLVGSTFFYQGGPPFNSGADTISTITLPTLSAELGAVHRPFNTLGWGAGLSSTASGNYFAAGTTPDVYASFDPWWLADASHLQLSYSVEDTTSLDAETVPAPTVVPLPTTAAGLADIPVTIPAADQLPGPYLVQAVLTDTSTSPPTTVGSTCMPYTVGATGDRLDLASLPSGSGAGGPSDPRGVALNAQLGLDGLRGVTINWSTFLPNCSASAPTAATCGPSAMTFANASEAPFQASYLANQDHVAYWLQASGGSFGSVPTALVNDGWWKADTTALVSYYSKVPTGCAQCAPVTKWEPWNEPDNTGWGTGSQYVSSVLEPFYQAVKSVLPGSASTVIGGSSLGVPLTWWQQLIAANGLDYLDVASVHPYTGNNDSFEEDSNQTEVRELQAVLGSTPLWFTEVGWWNDGDYNYLAQADIVARAMIWQKVLNIPVWNYFFDEGSWGNDGVSFSLIQAGSSDDYVKPAALSTMATSTQIADRPYVSMPATGIPQTYQADFGPGTASGSDNQLAAVWSDGLDTTSSVTVTAPGGGSVPVTVTSEYGDATATSVNSGTAYSLPISDQVTYVSYPVGDTLSVGPTEGYGSNLALLSAGATATASSGNADNAINGLQVGSSQGWSSSAGDTTPSLTVTLPGPATINRIVVDTQSNGSTAFSLRNYAVEVDSPLLGWTTVATVVGQYRTHELQLAFNPVTATGVRIAVSEINFGGYYGGGIPPWWSPTYGGVGFVHAVQVYGGTDTPDQIAGTGLTPLLTGNSGTPPTTTTTEPSTTTTTEPSTTTTTEPSTTTTTEPSTTTTTEPSTTTTTEPSTTTTTTTEPSTTTTTEPSTTTTTEPSTTTTTEPSTTTTTEPSTTTTTPEPSTTTTTEPSTTTTTEPSTTTTTPQQNGSGQPNPGGGGQPGGHPPTVISPEGYRLVTSGGTVYHFGHLSSYGSELPLPMGQTVVGMASTPSGHGYWLVSWTGGVYSFGDAGFYGSTGGEALNKPIVGMASTPSGRGYWLVASDGGIFAFGDARFYGSTGAITLNKPIVGMASTPSGHGYWLVASDGGVFAFGDAGFHGSTGGLTLNKPIVGMTAAPGGHGYWLVASDGGIFAFGNAGFYGSTGGITLNKPIVGMAAAPGGRGYWLVASDGGIFACGDAGFYGSTGAFPPTDPVVGIT